MPANHGGIFWTRYRADDLSKSDIELEYRSAMDRPWKSIAFRIPSTTRPHFLKIEPYDGFAENGWYRLSAPRCAGPPLDTTFQTGSTATVPKDIGRLRVVEKTTGMLEVQHGASCGTRIRAAQARVEVSLSNRAQPWSDVIRYQTFVDGEPWNPAETLGDLQAPGESWKGRGVDVVYAACDRSGWAPDPNLEPGRHTVYMEAAISTDERPHVIRTNEVQVHLGCGSGDPPISDDVGPGPDTDAPDTHSGDDIGSPQGDTGSPGTVWGSGKTRDGCGCAAGAPKGGVGALGVVLGVLFFVVRRGWRRE